MPPLIQRHATATTMPSSTAKTIIITLLCHCMSAKENHINFQSASPDVCVCERERAPVARSLQYVCVHSNEIIIIIYTRDITIMSSYGLPGQAKPGNTPVHVSNLVLFAILYIFLCTAKMMLHSKRNAYSLSSHNCASTLSLNLFLSHDNTVAKSRKTTSNAKMEKKKSCKNLVVKYDDSRLRVCERSKKRNVPVLSMNERQPSSRRAASERLSGLQLQWERMGNGRKKCAKRKQNEK